MSTGPSPEWDEAFAWAFDSPPKGQKLHISCKNKSKIGKVMPRHTITQNYVDIVICFVCSDTLAHLLLILKTELIRESNHSDRSGGYVRISFWRIHSTSRKQKRAIEEFRDWVPMVQQINSQEVCHILFVIGIWEIKVRLFLIHSHLTHKMWCPLSKLLSIMDYSLFIFCLPRIVVVCNSAGTRNSCVLLWHWTELEIMNEIDVWEKIK